MIEKWQTISKEDISNQKIFNITHCYRKHPTLDKQGKFVVLDSPTWVNIIPITKNKEVVLIEQYRHGSDSVTIEIPGGLVEKGEEPRLAAQRECQEETGFASLFDAVQMAEITPNPAYLNNFCYSFVWFDCEKKFDQQLDGNEDIHSFLVPLEQIPQMILDGKIKHSLVIDAFYFYSLLYGFNGK